MLCNQKYLEKYLHAHYRRNYYKTDMEMEDYVQEGLCVYLEIENHYHDVTEPAHLFALFKTSWSRRIWDRYGVKKHFSRIDSYEEETAVLQNTESNEPLESNVVQQFSGEALAVLNCVAVLPDELYDIAKRMVRTPAHTAPLRMIGSLTGLTRNQVTTAIEEILQC